MADLLFARSQMAMALAVGTMILLSSVVYLFRIFRSRDLNE
jgi:hypothetical protein